MGSFKKLKSSDVITTPVIANKQWNFSYCPIPTGSIYINVYNGTFITGTFDPTGEPITNGQYDRLMYAMIDQMFYHTYSGSLSTASLASSLFYESASGLRPTRSYFNFNDDPAFYKTFPTGVGESIKVIAVSPSLFGEQILPYSFQMSSSAYNFKDNGKGNVYDGTTQVGNIFYPEGIIVITNQDYQTAIPLPPVAYNDSATYYTTDTGSKTINILANDVSRSCAIDTGSVVLYGDNASNYTVNANGTITLNVSSSQNYDVYYTVNSICGNGCTMTSNQAKVSVNIVLPPCTEYSVENPSNVLTRYFDYIDCDGVSQTATISPEAIVSICLTSYTDNVELIITQIGPC